MEMIKAQEKKYKSFDPKNYVATKKVLVGTKSDRGKRVVTD